jgi:hypothetical protein
MRFDPKELTVDQACEQYKQALQASVAHLVADCTCGQFHGVISVTQVRSLSEWPWLVRSSAVGSPGSFQW